MASWVLNRKKQAATAPQTTGTVGKKGPDDKLRAIFQHFDDNDDGYLSYQELRRLQMQTSGDDLDGPTFCALCEEFKCQPQRGLTLDALRATYEDGDGIDGGAEGSASIDEDYDKIFPDGEEDASEDGGQDDGEDGGDVEDAIFRELVGKEKNGPQQAAASDDAEQAKKGGHSKTIWTDVELNHDESDGHVDDGGSDTNAFRACNIGTATKVRDLHCHFDLDRNKFLSYSELSALQLATSGEHLEGPEYCHLCRENQCDPRKGLSLKALQTIYEESGIDHLDQDYDKVFAGRDPKELMPAATPQKMEDNTASSTTFGISLPDMPSPSHLSNMLFGSGAFGGAIAQDDSEVADRAGGDMDTDGETEEDGVDQIIIGEDEDETEGEESSGLLARISRTGSPGRSKPLHVDDNVRTLHQFFDIYNTGRLGYCELRNMQLRTSGDDLDVEEYRMICEELGVDPREGLSVEALQQTYSSGGGNIRDDYKKVFPSESVAAMFSSPEVKDLGINLHGDYPFLAAERLEKIVLIFKYFDEDKNGLLSYKELRQLQLQTSGEDMDGPQFSTVCSMYKCDPHDGLTLENLRDIYTSQGVDSSLDDDYRKVYRKYVWSLQEKRNTEKDRINEKESPSTETASGHEEEAKGGNDLSKEAKDGDELTQQSGEGSMEKKPVPDSFD